MAFLRFSRDKRGYENFYLVQPTTRRGKSRNRILYWFRTPPGVKVGRVPFDARTRHTLEARNPDVVFNWQELIDTPIPPPAPDVERWRERRRLERAAKQAAAAEAAAESADAASEEGEPTESPATTTAEPPAAAEATDAAGAGSPSRRRRRRGGRRGRTDAAGAPGSTPAPGEASAQASTPSPDPGEASDDEED